MADLDKQMTTQTYAETIQEAMHILPNLQLLTEHINSSFTLMDKLEKQIEDTITGSRQLVEYKENEFDENGDITEVVRYKEPCSPEFLLNAHVTISRQSNSLLESSRKYISELTKLWGLGMLSRDSAQQVGLFDADDLEDSVKNSSFS
jgi:hypothetical protein